MEPAEHQENNQTGNIYTPSELNHEARLHLEAGFGRIWVEGEISNLSRPASGHVYFSLKDDKAQINCALFRSNTYGIGFKPENGMLVRARGRVSLFEARGNYQLIADSLVRSGEGLLRAKFELLKNDLATEGLFAEEHKQALPAFPLRIAVVTSPSGAALRDILNVLQRRWPLATVRIYGVPVQGNEARGGGSLEDLWAFNEESVARAIYASEVPVVSAVGHEIDFSISDFVADLRAPTPSAAAELISPHQNTLRQHLSAYENRLQQRIMYLLQRLSQKLDHLSHRLQQQHPGQRLVQNRKTLHQAAHRLQIATKRIVSERQRQLHELARHRLLPAGKRIVPQRRVSLENLVRTLNAVSPLPTLARGYAIVTDAQSGKAISSVRAIKPKQTLVTQLHDGQVVSKVDKTNKSIL
jgi:exodeoxyribonuclease VII large subunit